MVVHRKYTRELLTEAVEASSSVAGVLRFLGLNQAGGTHSHISRTIKFFELDTSHFRRGLPIARHHARLMPEQILIMLPVGSRRARPHMLTRALVESGMPYQCAICGCDGWWQGMPLTLEVDHIDGDYCNNLLANLRFLCPNCHRQTANFAGRNKGRRSARATAASDRTEGS